MYILGISCFYHDAAAALLHDGHLVAAAEEERFSRKKHDLGYPEKAIAFCLAEAGITANELDHVVFYEKPLLKFERILLTTLQMFPQSYKVFRESMITWFNEKLWIKSHILTTLNIPDEKLLFVEHHLSHAASAFFCSPYQEAAILTVDGVGEWTTTAVGRAVAHWPDQAASGQRPGENRIDLFEEIRFPHSLGLLYSAFTAFLGFRVNSGEYKVMGMAPYGRATRLEDIYKTLHVNGDGSFQLNMDYFSFHHSTSRTYNDRFIRLFGEPRVDESDFYTPTTHPDKNYPGWDDATAQRNQHYADIAASIQRATEDTILKIAQHAYDLTGLKKLCIAGGVALNSVANGRILRESPFEDVYIQPAAGDSGGALGAALYAYHVLLGQPRRFVMEHAYWGQSYGPDQIRHSLDQGGWRYEHVEHPDQRAALMVEDILAGKVISLFQGRFEWGPRALGNRSILADPRPAAMKDIVNQRIKFREPFRPFAPVILEDEAPNFYQDLTEPGRHYPLRYMLMVYNAQPGQGEKIQAVTHYDNSGRMQTVRPEWNYQYHKAIELFGQATGVPVLLNTSFNLRGEPMVNSPGDALKTFSNSGIDTLYMGDFVIRK
jgi:carbamoyltransferase